MKQQSANDFLGILPGHALQQERLRRYIDRVNARTQNTPACVSKESAKAIAEVTEAARNHHMKKRK